MKKVLFILGPTAVGKSDMALFLAKKFDGEVISADSVQVYRGLDIGSAKIEKDEMNGVKHHLIDICEPNDEFSVAEFVKLTEEKIEEISSRGKLSIVCGGTFLYVKALTEGYNLGGFNKNEEFRQQTEKEIEEKGALAVWKRLDDLSPELAEKVHPNNKKRLVRALEIATFGEGKCASSQKKYDCKLVALTLPREELYLRINMRVQKMLGKGLIEEVRMLLEKGAKENSQAMQAIGYKETISFLKGEIDKWRMEELIKQHSRNYAKRQMTFLRSLNDVAIVDVSDYKKAKQEVEKQVEEWK